jgi:hypothetical protein
MRPLLSAIVAAHPGSRVFVLAHPSLSWLLPPKVEVLPSVHGVRPWQRLDRNSAGARVLGSRSVPVTARLLRPVMSARVVRLMTAYLRLQEFPVVINLLELLVRFSSSDGWWQPGCRNVVDVVADALQEAGVPVPEASRAPRLDLDPVHLPGGQSALLSTCAGSALKEAPAELWREVASGLSSRGFRTHVIIPPGHEPDPALVNLPSVAALSASLPELARMIAGASMVVSVDTGVLHLAAATRAPHVGIFGATDPAFSGPYDRSCGELVAAPFEHPKVCCDCWAAQMLPSARCPIFTPASCLSTVTAGEVLAAVDRVRG